MCALNVLLLLLVCLSVPALGALHLSISMNQRGDISDFFLLSARDRIVDLTITLGLVGIVILIALTNCGEDLARQALATAPIKLILGYVFFAAAIAILCYLKNIQTKLRISAWLKGRGYEVLEFHWCVFDNPWSRDSSGIFSGRSDSQSCYKVELRDQDGNKQIAYLLWGSYFGLSVLTGKVRVELLWDKVLQLESRRERARQSANPLP